MIAHTTRVSRTGRGILPTLALALATVVGASGCSVMLLGLQDRENRFARRNEKRDPKLVLKLARDLAERPLSPEPGKKLRFALWGLYAHRVYATSYEYDETLRREAEAWYRSARALASASGERGRRTNKSAPWVGNLPKGLETTAEVDLMYAALLVETGRAGEALAFLDDPGIPDNWLSSHTRGLALLARGDVVASREAFARADVHMAWAPDLDAAMDPARWAPVTAGGGVAPGFAQASGTSLLHHQLRLRLSAWAQPENHPGGDVDPRLLLALWQRVEAVGRDAMTKTYPVYLEGARIFADAGETDVAKALLRTAARANRMDGGSVDAPLEQTCAAAYVAGQAGADVAIDAVDTCLRRSARKKRRLSPEERTVFAHVLASGGRDDEAQRLLDDAIDDFEATRASFPVEGRAQFFRTSARHAYWARIEILARSARGKGPGAGDAELAEALRTAELVRARQLGEVLVSRGREIAEFQDLEQLRARIQPGEVVVSFVATNDAIFVFAINRSTWVVHEIVIPADEMERYVADVARALATPKSDPVALGERLTLLGRSLLVPCGALVEDASIITVLPDGVLNTLPFDLLSIDEGEWRPLLQTRAVRSVPSLGFLLSDVRGKSLSAGILAVGDPIMPAGIPPLPETRTEIERIAASHATTRVDKLLGGDALESAFKARDLSSYGAIHIATHGILGRELPGVTEPALILAPEEGEDGMLTASEVNALTLDAEIAVLSACKTGLGDTTSGEGVFGLSRSFILAGARSVVVSLWSVDSRATEALMVAFYEALGRGVEPWEALRSAKLSVRDGGATATPPRETTMGSNAEDGTSAKRGRTKRRTDTEATARGANSDRHDQWLHPYYWAGFTMMGR